MTNLYIAGPMRNRPQFNFPAFFDAEKRLQEAGYKTFNPARRDEEAGMDWQSSDGTETMPVGSGFNIRECMAVDTAFICNEADGVALLDGWATSKGARAEKALAEACGLPVMYVEEWLQASETPEDDEETPLRVEVPERGVEAVERPLSAAVAENGEVRVTNETTGGQKGQKLARFDLIPVQPLTEVAKLYGAGAQKYADRNWEKGYAWSLSYGALMRHVTQFWDGESMDSETKRHHLASVIFHCLALMQFERTHPELDDRP